MGTEMQMFVEKFVDGRWVYVHTPDHPPRVANLTESPIDWYYEGGFHNYDTMSFLCGVRNNDEIPVIEPKWRKMPEDASEELKAAYEWNLDSGVHWLTLAEVKAYDFDQLVWKPARVLKPDLVKPGEEPDYDIQSRDHNGKIRIKGYELRQFPVRRLCTEFLEKLLPKIETVCNTTPDNIRLIMWFDW